jgi:hypothetical protein
MAKRMALSSDELFVHFKRLEKDEQYPFVRRCFDALPPEPAGSVRVLGDKNYWKCRLEIVQLRIGIALGYQLMMILRKRPKRKSKTNRDRNEQIRRESKKHGGTKSLNQLAVEYCLSRSGIQSIIATPPVRKLK